MKIWLLEKSEKTRPHEIFNVRDRISSGELDGDTPAWYDGADDWVTLADVPALESYFKNTGSEEESSAEEEGTSELLDEQEKDRPETIDEDVKGGDGESLQHKPLHPIRRGFARFFDLSVYSILVYVIKVKMGINPLVYTDVMNEILWFSPYLLLDGFALSYFGMTPGKWMLNVSLRGRDGEMLEFSSSLIRSIRVWVLGFAMWSPLVVLSIPLVWFIGNKYGRFLWDIPKQNVVYCSALKPAKIALFVGMLLLLSVLFQAVVPTEYYPTLENFNLANPRD